MKRQVEFNHALWMGLHYRCWRHFISYPLWSARLLWKRLAYTWRRRFVGATLVSPVTGEKIWCEMTLTNYWAMHVVREFPDALEADLRLAMAPVVFDIGSNLGQFKGWVLQANPSTRVITVDAQPEVKADFQCAVSDSSIGFAQLGTNGMTAGGIYSGPAFAAQRATIDWIWGQCDFPEIYLLKVDIDGGELAALGGATHALRHTRAVLVELNDDVRELLDAAGFDAGVTVNGADYYFVRKQ